MDLEQFRQSKGLSYKALAELLGLAASNKRRAQSYAIGETWPPADRIEEIISATDGQVTLDALHQRRLQWLKENNKISLPPNSDADAEGDESE